VRILITNVFLDERGGTQLYVAELAEELLRRGHHPVVYSPIHGHVAAELVARTVPVVSDLASIGEAPDVIHGHHALETISALVRFPRTPALYVAHDWAYRGDSAPKHPRIHRYLAVDDTLRDRLVAREGIPADLVGRTRNWVDTRRFLARSTPLPARPTRALVFSNLASDTTFLPMIRTACERRGIHLDVAGSASGRVIDRPEDVLGTYDLVFAKARAAIEAMGSGCAVVLCDLVGFGGLVSSDRFQTLREVNFGRRCLSEPITCDAVTAAIDAYDADDARRVCEMIRAGSSQVGVIDELIEQYEQVIAEHGTRTVDAELDGAAAAAVFGVQSKYIRTLEQEFSRLHTAADQARSEADHARSDATALASAQLDAAQADLVRAQTELHRIKASSTFVARDRLFARAAVTRGLLPLVRRAAGRR
jgi:Glycosyltransferase Family 4